MARTAWRRIAEQLAERIATNDCETHPPSAPEPNCPWCRDREAYQAYLAVGGHDFRPPRGQSIDVSDVPLTGNHT